jgi:hypothetical protein
LSFENKMNFESSKEILEVSQYTNASVVSLFDRLLESCAKSCIIKIEKKKERKKRRLEECAYIDSEFLF